MALSGVIASEVVGLWTGFYTVNEIRKMSVKKITNPVSMDNLGAPIRDGLYDPSLGPLEQYDICETCGLIYEHCPGHVGHIELAVPLYQPVLFGIMYKILKSICFNCHRFRQRPEVLDLFVRKTHLLSKGELIKATKLHANATKDELSEYVEKTQELDADASGAPADIGSTESLRLHIYEYQKEILSDFFKSIPSRNCSNCKAYNPNLKKEGQIKIFQTPIPKKFKVNNNAIGASVGELSLASDDHIGLFQGKKEDENKDEDDEEMEDEQPVNNIKILQTGPVNSPKQTKKDEGNQNRYIPPIEVKKRFELLFDQEPAVVTALFSSVNDTLFKGQNVPRLRTDPNIFFNEVIPVSPNRFRPPSRGVRVGEHPQNTHLSKILGYNKKLMLSQTDEKQKITVIEAINITLELQKILNFLIDNSKAPLDTPSGIKQLLEKKEGLFRKHMMGKRVNYAARSVISPDPYVNTNEIVVPEVFAKKLTFPQPVTSWNYKELSEFVINGPDVHPGANIIEDEMGNKIMLKGGKKFYEQRVALSKTLLTPATSLKPDQCGVNKKVYRHLKSGDHVIMNRQPTLHKPSMMVHKVRVQKKGRVLRMHYANCKTYNADFDGDEMNLHFPQTFQAMSDAKNIMFTDKQYIVPTNGGPLRGLIQDHVCSGVLLTKKDTFFTKHEFQELMYSCLNNVNTEHPYVTPRPAILKPQPLWTGKQVISALLRHLTINRGGKGINLESKACVPEYLWGPESGEGTVIIRNNDLLTGVLDKNQFGAAAFGLVHTSYDLYGPTMAGLLLSTLGVLLTTYLQFAGLTCGIDDLLLTPVADAQRDDTLKTANPIGVRVYREFADLSKEHIKEDALSGKHNNMVEKIKEKLLEEEDYKRLDNSMKAAVSTITTKVIDNSIPSGQVKKFPKNHLSLMIISGAKGSQVNVSQISCLLGQQELEGRRVPVMFTGKTLPCFDQFDPRARAGGFVGDRFLTGIRPQEYYFHCMAGREGLVDTAVKTSNSGYLQRCLIKHLEGMVVQYDYSVREFDGSVIQFKYGEDCIDPCASKFLDRFSSLADNFEILESEYRIDEAVKRNAFDSLDKVEKYYAKADKAANKVKRYQETKSEKEKRKKKSEDDVVDETVPTLIDPILSNFNPGASLGAVSELYYKQLNEYLDKDPDHFFTEDGIHDVKAPDGTIRRINKYGKKIIPKDHFKIMMFLKYHKCLVNPGEAVGVLAGQSVGEPSTQMTLNTFHLAGHGGANVTLGIPRMREIIMTASDHIKTPSMALPLKPGSTEDNAYDLANNLYRLLLPELLQEVIVKETLIDSSTGFRLRSYQITLQFHNKEFIKREHSKSMGDIENLLIRSFLPTLLFIIKKEIKAKVDLDIGVGVSSSSISGASDDNEGGNEEADTTKKIINDDVGVSDTKGMKKKEHASYVDVADNDDSDDDVVIPIQAEDMDEGVKNEKDDLDEKIDADARELKQKYVSFLKGKYGIFQDYNLDVKNSRFTFIIQIPADNKKLLMVSLVEKAAQNFVISDVPGIKQCYITSKDKKYTIVTEGVNFNEVWKFAEHLDVNNIYSNDISAILNTYGVEAARACIMNEISNVFGAYGIRVDRRHLSVIADYMTFSGGYKPLNRMGMEVKPSPLLKMSFETTMKFLADSALYGQYDPLTSPSSRLVLGVPVRNGSGFFDVLQPLL